MPNPAFLFCDSDALIQAFITRELRPFQELKRRYAIQIAIVPEVEAEVSWTKNFGSRFDPELRKAISRGTVQVLTPSVISAVYGNSAVPTPTLQAAWESIQATGAKYNRHVGRGEAYTFAAALYLGVPAISHDRSALDTLLAQGMRVPNPTLRFFDLLAHSLQIGVLTEAQCDRIRATLLREREWIPGAFKNASVTVGLSGFDVRILDSAMAGIGTEPPPPGTHYETPLVISCI